MDYLIWALHPLQEFYLPRGKTSHEHIWGKIEAAKNIYISTIVRALYKYGYRSFCVTTWRTTHESESLLLRWQNGLNRIWFISPHILIMFMQLWLIIYALNECQLSKTRGDISATCIIGWTFTFYSFVWDPPITVYIEKPNFAANIVPTVALTGHQQAHCWFQN